MGTPRQVRAHVIPNGKRETLMKAILERVGFGATLHTDSAPAYDRVDARYVHEQVNHMVEYVRGNVSTQAVENFWSCLKRTLNGTYVAVEATHMDKYLAEQCFRFNNRINMNDGDRFVKALAQVGGKRLTWNTLTRGGGLLLGSLCGAWDRSKYDSKISLLWPPRLRSGRWKAWPTKPAPKGGH